MNKLGDMKKSIIRAITELVNDAVNKAPFDKTVKGMVTEKINDKQYKVQINDSEYVARSNHIYAEGDIVMITIPQNQYKDMIIIYGG